jgi:hypothetical protein
LTGHSTSLSGMSSCQPRRFHRPAVNSKFRASRRRSPCRCHSPIHRQGTVHSLPAGQAAGKVTSSALQASANEDPAGVLLQSRGEESKRGRPRLGL